MGRVAAIAVDALEWWFLEQQLQEGGLPNLARLRKRSATWQLETPMPYRSELVWARFLTGREPIDDREWAVSITFDPGSYGIGLNTASTRPPFFAFGPGTKVVSLDLIHATVADGVDGLQVVAWGSHSPQWPRSAQPPGLVDELDRRFGVNPAFGNDFNYGWHDPSFIDALARANEVGGRRRVEISRWLLQEHQPDWDLFLVCLSEFHSLGHQLWHGVDPTHPLHDRVPTSDQAAKEMSRGLAVIDELVGELLQLVGDDTTVVLFALHGFQPGDDLASSVLLPELLQRHHLGRALLHDPDQARWRRSGCPPVVPVPQIAIGSYLADRFADGIKQRARRAAAERLPAGLLRTVRAAMGRSPGAAMAAMAKPVPPEDIPVTAEAIERVRKPPTYEPAYWYRPHWKDMAYFSLPSFADGRVRLNLAGRERDGIVAGDDYRRALDDVERLLLGCRDARTGRPVVADVLRVRADDPFAPDGPEADLLVVWDGAPDALEHAAVGTVGPFPHLRMSHHSVHGFAMAAGPGITPGARGRRPAGDLTPTIIELLGRDAAGVVGRSLLSTASR